MTIHQDTERAEYALLQALDYALIMEADVLNRLLDAAQQVISATARARGSPYLRVV